MESIAGVKKIIECFKDKIKPGNCLFVHGGGPEISCWLNKFDMDVSFVNGQRVTDSRAVKVVEMVLSGRVNKLLVSAFNSLGYSACGLSGRDGNTAVASIIDKKLGYVGKVEKIDPGLLKALMEKDFIPVVSPVCSSADFGALNVNADFFASAVAAAFGARELDFITSTGGVLKGGEVIGEISLSDIEGLIESGIVSRGMLPKLLSARKAIEGGVERVNMIDFKGTTGTVIK